MKVENKKVKRALKMLKELTGVSYELRTENTRPDRYGNQNKYFLYVAENAYIFFKPTNAFKTQNEFVKAVELFSQDNHNTWALFGYEF